MKRFTKWLALLLVPSVAVAAVTVTVNGTNYTIPQTNERGWGTNVTTWIQAASSHLLQKTGGTFTLSNEIDFGATYGLKSAYLKSQSSNLSTAGWARLANTDAIGWRNSGSSANLLLKPNAATSNTLSFDGIDLVGTSLSQVLTNKTFDAASNSLSGISNVNISGSAAIARTKIATGTASHVLVNAGDGALSSEAELNVTRGGTGKNLSGSSGLMKISSGDITAATLLNADVSASAAIARSKLAVGTASHVVINDGSGAFSSEAELTVSRGGTGRNLSGASGVLKISSGTVNATTVALASDVSGTLAVANGGTGQTSASTAINALVPSQGGNSGKFLTTNGSAVSWDTAGGALPDVAAKTANYTVLTTDDVLTVDGSGGAFTLTLYTAAGNAGRELKVVRTDDTPANAVTIDGDGSETINAQTTYKLFTLNEAVTIVSNGTNWYVTNHRADTAWVSDTNIALTSLGTLSSHTNYWRRVGDTLFVRGAATSGTPVASAAYFSLPAGKLINTSKIGSNSRGTYLGIMIAAHASDAETWGLSSREIAIFYDGSDNDQAFMAWQNSGGGFLKMNGSSLFASGMTATWEFSYPVVDWQP